MNNKELIEFTFCLIYDYIDVFNADKNYDGVIVLNEIADVLKKVSF